MAKQKRILTEEERQKQREYQKRWRQANPDKTRAYERRKKRDPKVRYQKWLRWIKANPDKARAQRQRRTQRLRKNRPEKIKEKKRRYEDNLKNDPERYERINKNRRAKSAKWVSANRDRDRANRRRRYQENLHEARAKTLRTARRRRNIPGSHSVEQWLARVAYYGWRCRWCRRELTDKTLTKDHVIAVAKGGTDWASNLVPACGPCNSGKNTKRHYVPPALDLLEDCSGEFDQDIGVGEQTGCN